MTEEIFALARALSGAGEEEEGLRKLCAQAEQELAARLKEGVTAGDCAEAFALAAAWTALADWRAGEDLEGVSAFSAGDLTLESTLLDWRDGTAVPVSAMLSAPPEELRRRAEAVLAPYLADRGFHFQGVPG